MSRSKTKKKHTVLWIILVLLAAIIAYGGILAYHGYQLLEPAKKVWSDLNSIRATGLNTDTDTIRRFTDNLEVFSEGAEEFLQRPSVKMTRIVPRAAELEDLALSGLELADKAIPALFRPLPDLLDQYPFKEIATDEGYNINYVLPYMDYAEENLPLIRECLEFVQSIDDPLVKQYVPLDDIQALCADVLEHYDYISQVFEFVRIFVGNGEDKAYFLGLSNSAELRAGGGFLGSASDIRIENGILKLGPFTLWNGYLELYYEGITEVTSQEFRMFSKLMTLSNDATYDPDFTRIGRIWSDCYTAKTGHASNGAIGITPAIVQKLLKAANKEIKLSDGSVLNGDNATKVLQYDLYYKFFSAGQDAGKTNPISDALFAEAGNKVKTAITSNLNIETLLGFLDVFKDSSNDRTLMVWMRDTKEEDFVKQLGCSGALNFDKNAPEVGIFFSNKDANKMGMFFDMNIKISDPKKNEDGSCSYDVKVIFESKMSDEEFKNATKAIYGTIGGKLRGFVHLFAPMGGAISDVKSSTGKNFKKEIYQGLEVQYALNWYMERNVPYEVTFQVTTAPGVDTPLRVQCTPTIYKYTHPET